MAPPRLPTVTLMQPTLVHRPFHREGLIFEEALSDAGDRRGESDAPRAPRYRDTR